MKKVLTISMLVFALSGGYAFAQGIDTTKGTGADTGDKKEVSVVDHARYCTKNMKGVSSSDSKRTVTNMKDNTSSNSNTKE